MLVTGSADQCADWHIFKRKTSFNSYSTKKKYAKAKDRCTDFICCKVTKVGPEEWFRWVSGFRFSSDVCEMSAQSLLAPRSDCQASTAHCSGGADPGMRVLAVTLLAAQRSRKALPFGYGNLKIETFYFSTGNDSHMYFQLPREVFRGCSVLFRLLQSFCVISLCVYTCIYTQFLD